MSSFLPFSNSGGGPPSGSAGGDLGSTYPNPTVVSISGPSPIAITPASLQWTKGTSSPGITQATPTSDVATQNITITSQAPYASASTNKSPGNIVLNVPAPVSGGTHGNISLEDGGTAYATLTYNSNIPITGSTGCALTAVSTNKLLISSNSNALILDANAGAAYLRGQLLTYTSGLNLQWASNNVSSNEIIGIGPAVAAPYISQRTPASDVATANITIQAQSAYASASTYTSGGNLILEGGNSKTAGTGVGGQVSIASGLLQKTHTVAAASYTCDSNAQTSDLILLVSYTSTGAVALTLPAVVAGRTVYVKDIGAATSNNITITPASGTIDGASTYVLSKTYDGVMLVSDGTNWFVIGEYNGTVI